MKFGVSNLAWAASAEGKAFELLAQQGFSGVEVAPTRIAGWDELTDNVLRAFRQTCEAAGLEISSLQAILFNRPEAKLLDDAAAFNLMREHIKKIADVATGLGAKVAVFGAPRNRLRNGLATSDANQLGAERLQILGDIAASNDIVLGLEPVPAYYGGDFMQRAEEVAAMVVRCGHPNIRAHFDCGCIMLGGDDVGRAIRSHAGLMAHYHAAEPDLGPFSILKSDHAAAAAALREIEYSGWVVIEMRQQGPDGLQALQEALVSVRNIYQ